MNLRRAGNRTDRTITIILAILMMLTVIPAGNGLAEEVHSHEGWEAVDALPIASGSYYLTKDIEISSPWTIASGVTIDLCLNDHSITMTADNKAAISINGGTLNLYDCGTTVHSYTTDTWPAVIGSGSGSFTGGYITHTSGKKGQGVLMSYGVFNLHSGTIIGNWTVGNGANVLLNFNMGEQAYSYGSNTCSFCVKTGGTLRQTARFSLGYMFSIWNDGGVVAFDRVVSSGFDGHLNHVWLKDGASVTAANIYSGKMHAGNFVVYGSSPSTAEMDTLYLYGDNSSTEENPKPRTFMVEVEDVTGDGGADFTFTGRILTPRLRARRVTSSPAITMTSLVASATSMPFRIAATVGASPERPTVATRQTSASFSSTACSAASSPT